MSKEGVGDTSDLTQTGWGVVLTLKRRRGRRTKLTGTELGYGREATASGVGRMTVCR